MRFQTSLGLTALVGALLASPVYAENCSISYYCYRSMTPGAAPIVTPVATSRPAPNGSVRPSNLQQPRPVTNQVTRVQPPVVRPSNTTTTRPVTVNQLLVEQQRAQTLADQQRLANLRRNPSTTTSTNTTNRMSTPPLQTPVRVAAPQNFQPVDNQSCNTLSLKIKVLESQATSQAQNKQQAKAQELFKVAADLRKQAQAKSCTL